MTTPSAINMTPAQLTTLMADVAADATFGAGGFSHSFENAIVVANAYNTVDATTWVWKTSLLVKDIIEQQGDGGTSWDMTQYLALDVAHQNSWNAIAVYLVLDPSSAQLRAHVANLFAAGSAIRNHLLAISRRNPTRLEKLFQVSGAGTTGNPWTMGLQGPVTPELIMKGWH